MKPIEKAIYSKLVDGDKESVMSVLDYAISKSNNPKAINILIAATDQFLLRNIGTNRLLSPFNVVPKRWGLSYYVASFIRTAIASVKNGTSLKHILADKKSFVDRYEASSGKMMSEKKVENVLAVADQFGVTEMLEYGPLNGNLLNICLIPYGHKLNSVYSPALHIIGCHRTRDDNPPEYVFMHELGHIIQFYLTKTTDEVVIPKSFYPVFELVFGRPIEASFEGIAEVFADCFAVALAFGTELAPRVPFCSIFIHTHQLMLHNYFQMIAKDSMLANSLEFWQNEERLPEIRNILQKKPTPEELQLLVRHRNM